MTHHQGKKYFHLTIGTALMLFLGLLYAWSIFRAPFSAAFPSWSGSQLSMPFTLSMIFFCIGGFAGGKLASFIKSAGVLRAAAMLVLGGFILVSRLNVESPESSLARLYIFYGVLGGGGVGMGYNAILGTVTKWFPGRTGFASGVLLMGFGFGGIILGSATHSAIESFGLFPTFFVLGIVIAAVMLAGSFFIKLPPVAASSASTTSAAVKNYTPSEMIRTPKFWLFFIWSIAIAASGLMVVNSAASIALAFGAPAVLGLVVSVSNGAGRVIFGLVIDKLGRSLSMILCAGLLLSAGAVMLAGALTQNAALIIMGLVLTGASYGGSPSMSAAVINSFFGPKNFAVNVSVNNFLLIPAALIGPPLSGALQESSGGYISTFVVIMIFAAAAFALKLVLDKVAE